MKLKVLNDQRERMRFIRFSVVGAIGAFVDFGTFNLLNGVFRIDPIWASVVSFTVAIISNFTWNRYWTYPDSRSKPLGRQLLEFAVVNLIGLAIRTPLFAGLSGPLEAGFDLIPIFPIWIFTPEFLGHNGALAFAVLVVMLWNFFINRYWTYSDID